MPPKKNRDLGKFSFQRAEQQKSVAENGFDPLQISRIDASNDEVLFNLMDELEEEELAARGFRHQSLKTQRRQDYHLTMYRAFIRLIHKKPPELVDKETDTLGFPPQHEKLYRQMRMFLVFVATRAAPRGSREYIEYSTLDQYRTSLLYWTKRICADLGEGDPPPPARLFNQMTEQMRSIYAKQTSTHRSQRRMPAIGLAELRQLIDHDVISAVCPENAEQHHLAWCIGRQSALRAASLCVREVNGNEEYLRWEDIELTKEPDTARFTAVVTIRNLKTSRGDPESGQHRDAICHFDSPNAENIIFSVPHRLLLIALRRDLLEDENITTVDDILSTRHRHIAIKKERRLDPVFFGATARGLSLSDKPMSVTALQSYLRSRGRALGYKEDISFHAIRRQTATDLARRIGLDAAREIMGHAPDSRTLERYYINARPTMDMTAATLNEAITRGGQNVKKASVQAPFALSALDSERLRRLRGAALNRLVRHMIEADPDFPVDTGAQRQYKKRARRLAVRSLKDEEHEAQRSSMSIDDAQSRIDMLGVMRFSDQVRKRALEYNKKHTELTADENTGTVDYDEDFEEPEEEDEPEEDVEDRQGHEDGNITIQTQGEEFAVFESTEQMAQSADRLSYEDVARSFMEVVHTHALNEYKAWSERDADEKVCRLCRADDTVPAITRFKQYDTKQHLEAHENSAYHSPYKTWMRRRKLEHDGQDAEDRLWYCPYQHDTPRSYTTLEKMVEHVVNSKETTTSKEHEAEKALDGWFDDDFAWTSTARKDTWQTERLRLLRQCGVMIPAAGPKRPIPHPQFSELQYGPRASTLHPLRAGVRRGCDISTEERSQDIADAHPGIKALLASRLAMRLSKPGDVLGAVPHRYGDLVKSGSDTQDEA